MWFWLTDWDLSEKQQLWHVLRNVEYLCGDSEIRNRNPHHYAAICYIYRLCSFISRWIGTTTTLMTSARTFLEPGNIPVCRDCPTHAGGRTRCEAMNVQGWRKAGTSLACFMRDKLMSSVDRKRRETLPFLVLILSGRHSSLYILGIMKCALLKIPYCCLAFKVSYNMIRWNTESIQQKKISL
jgi:hypothetical protein